MLVKNAIVNLVGRKLPFSQDRHKFFQKLVQVRLCSTMLNERIPFSRDFFFRQLFDDKSWTFTYLLADTKTFEAVLIDPGEIH
jgi:hypothetical protein